MVLYLRKLALIQTIFALQLFINLEAQNVLNTALDVNNLDFVNLGTYFSLDNEAGAEGGTALASNPTGNNGKATLRLKIEGPLSGTFNWKVSSEEQFDKLIFRIDGSVQDSCLLYTSPSPRDRQKSRMPSSA